MYVDYQTLGKVIRLSYRPSTLTWRRFVWAGSLFSAYGAVQALNGLGSLMDRPLKSTIEAQTIKAPICIVSVPRSGTTFLHRLMALDEQFTTLKLYQTIMPSVSAERLAQRLRKMADHHREITQVRHRVDRLFAGWDGQHNIGIDKDEEDEGIWVMAMAAPSVWLLVPFPHELQSVKFVDRWPEERRKKLVDHYSTCLKKHMYACARPGQTLLMKSVLASGRLGLIREAAPDARFIHLVRHPYDEIPSTVSMLTAPWRTHSPDIPENSDHYRAWADLAIDYALHLHEEKKHLLESQFVTVKYSDLVRDPRAQISRIYQVFGLEWTPQFNETLEAKLQEQKKYRSNHKYTLEQYGLEREYIYGRMQEIFDAYDFDP